MDTFSFERILVEKLKGGDKSAFSSLFTAYYSDLVMFATTFLKDLDSSEEIVQDVFLKLWEDREIITVTTTLKSFLLKLIQNRCLDWLRHAKVIHSHHDSVLNSSPLLECDTENYILRSEIEKIVKKALDKIPDEIAEPFKLNRYDGLKYREIAEKMQVSNRTVEVRIGKVLQILRDELKDYLITFLMLLSHLLW
ncbi:MAG: RNA polymerase sigma-70 factor [Bacteroidetes bacterium]|nr:RNA polymerase sigma-70 factor [Bacteroidota bacterium]NWJ53303.1 RNA polymerase sigma-70 factor [Bacteroidota bacterium]